MRGRARARVRRQSLDLAMRGGRSRSGRPGGTLPSCPHQPFGWGFRLEPLARYKPYRQGWGAGNCHELSSGLGSVK